MKRLSILLMRFVVTGLLLLSINDTHAQATRTWVSGVGDDVNPCSRTAPCKTFAGAISKTAAGGEISVLDPGGFGALTITKAITINGDGTLAGVVSSLVSGFTINAGPTDVVNIRGISINGITNGINGINYIAGGELHIEDCTITGFTTTGIRANLTTAGVLTVKNTTITNTDLPAAIGINLTTTTGKLTVSLDHVYVQGIPTGLNVADNTVATLSNSIISQSTNGIIGQNNGTVNVENCQVVNNVTGILAEDAASIIRISNVGIFDNTTGIAAGAGKIISFGNNKSAGNTNASAPVGEVATF